MKRKNFFLISGLAIICLISLPAGFLSRAAADNSQPFRLHDVYGHVIELSAFKGKWVLLNFWATWCGPCLKEIPSLEKLESREASRVVILGVSESLDGKKKLLEFILKHKMTYPVLIDGLGRVADAYRVHGLPYSVLIDPQGRISWTIEGAVNWTDPTFQRKFLAGPLKGQS
ncbi:TlpA family protein disulfide reductase [Leptospirillum ferriphilum]|jgi:peroxiredoxin|uniref:Thiol:disulfide oxidoreductase n=2 Tax=Leptospirillum TaxID=179 RepID=A0A094X813_9BACT|nr:TlpA disulfide reductase family protein [Leptospirillum ferriphilum]EDZ40036.1 MAG: Putative thioredoxin family protein [Leptospirillum sp. Group II '5-way CG']KGA94664.1 Thiol:disulfide oxidoreductase [Leptospirillum ferriphilum]